MKNKNLYIRLAILIGIIILLVSIFYIGKKQGINQQLNKEIEKEIKPLIIKAKITQYQIDSIKNLVKNKEVEKEILKKNESKISDKIKNIIIDKPKDSTCNDLYYKSNEKINLLNNQISIKDSIEKKSDEIINNQKEIISKKDTIIFYKDKHINLLENRKTVNKKFNFGINIGYGFSVNENKIDFKPYLGVGVTYKLFDF